VTAPAQAAALLLHADDHVATALRPLRAGERIGIAGGGRTIDVAVLQDVPLCHKVAVRPATTGERVLKYGEAIGHASAAIAVGEHVHVHNLRSARARSGG
jgi:altronate dehydratase small subunit